MVEDGSDRTPDLPNFVSNFPWTEPLLFSSSKNSGDSLAPTDANYGDDLALAFRAIDRFSPFASKCCEFPSGVGFGTAESLSKLAYLIIESVHGANNALLDQKTAKKALEVLITAYDMTTFSPKIYTRFGLVRSKFYDNSFYHSGNGGALVLGDTKYNFSLGYTQNLISANPTHSNGCRSELLTRAVYHVVKNLTNPQPVAKL